jgi:hypothetical protein
LHGFSGLYFKNHGRTLRVENEEALSWILCSEVLNSRSRILGIQSGVKPLRPGSVAPKDIVRFHAHSVLRLLLNAFLAAVVTARECAEKCVRESGSP